MDKTTENVTSLSHKPSNEEGWGDFLKANAKCFMRCVTVVKVTTLIGGVLLGAALFPITTLAVTIRLYRIKVDAAKDRNTYKINENSKEIKHFKYIKMSIIFALVCIPIVGPILHVISSPNHNIYNPDKSHNYDPNSKIIAGILSIPLVGSGAMAFFMLLPFLFPEILMDT